MELEQLLHPPPVERGSFDELTTVLEQTSWSVKTHGGLFIATRDGHTEQASSEAELLRRCWRYEDIAEAKTRIARKGGK